MALTIIPQDVGRFQFSAKELAKLQPNWSQQVIEDYLNLQRFVEQISVSINGDFGTMALQDADDVQITGGTINNVTMDNITIENLTVANITVLTANVTTLNVSGTATFESDIVFDGVTLTGVTGIDPTLVTGTAGTAGEVTYWNSDGDLVSEAGFSYNATTNLLTVPSLSVTGNATLGDASGDSLTINAGTWTIGNNYVSTRAVGTAPAGQSVFADVVTTASGDAGGTSDFRGERIGIAVTGSNNVTRAVGFNARAINQSTGTVSTLVANLYSAGSDTTVTTPIVAACLGDLFIINTGSITNAFGFRTPTPVLSSTGNITNLIGFSIADLGNATRVTNSIGFQADNMTASATLTVSFRSQQNSGTGVWGFLHTGTANNAFNGNVRIGSTTAPTVACDVTGAVYASTVVKTGGYTVATLPAGVIGMRAYVTDALAPAFLTALVGGGAVTCPAFYDGAAWVAG